MDWRRKLRSILEDRSVMVGEGFEGFVSACGGGGQGGGRVAVCG